MVEILHKTMHHFFPSFPEWLKVIDDPRQAGKIDYPLRNLISIGIFLFLLKVEARRQIKFMFSTEDFIKNLNLFAKTRVGTLAHPDTIGNLLERLNHNDLSYVIKKMVHRLIRMKCFVNYRLLNQYYLVVVDSTGHMAFKKRHCPHCLTKKQNGKVLYYYHNVLEAKLVLRNGMALSMGTEFIDNRYRNEGKQDCELRAFKRLVKKLKGDFPQLKICLLLDALYAAQSVFDICEDNKWKYIITFKRGSMPDTYREYEALKVLQTENGGYVRDGNITQRYHWVTDIAYEEHRLQALECNETKTGKKKVIKDTKFVWLTNLNVTRKNHQEIANEGGRLRWKIENEGFNMQKNGGYNLEHQYSKDEVAAKNFYLLLQIAHIINQLIEHGSLLKKQIKKVFGSIRNVSRMLLEALRTTSPDIEELNMELAIPFQIRFYDSS